MLDRVKRIAGYLKPYKLEITGAVICAGTVSLLWAAIAYIIEPVLDDIFIQKRMKMLVILPFVLIGIAIVKGGANYGRSFMMLYVGERITKDIRDQLHGHLLHMPLGFFGRFTTGKIMSRVLNDVSLMQNVLTNVVKDLFQQMFTMIVLAGVLFHQNWQLALMAIAVLPFTYYPIKRFSKRLRIISMAGQERLAEVSSLLQESFSGIRLVKAFNAEDYETDRFKSINQGYFRYKVKGFRVAEISPWLMEVIGGLGAALIIWTGGYQVIQGEMTPGEFFSFLAACWLMYTPMRRISSANNSIQQSLAAADRVFEILDTPSECNLARGSTVLPPFQKEIQFRDVSFSYDDHHKPALEEINLTVKMGEVIALVGHSGAGKTTLVNLIPKFYHPTKGAVLIDGMNLEEVSLSSIRDQVGIVSQDTFLFDDTIANNIAYGMKNFIMSEVESAAEMAFAHEFIKKLPKGYDTIIGERGLRLSGGERQRLSIARALLKNPPILILDEATSNLDSESERKIQIALGRLLAGRTTVIIAHRLSTAMSANRIVVMDQGRIVEVGQHEELIKKPGQYQKLYTLQFHDRRSHLTDA